jgi:hypothetical protein
MPAAVTSRARSLAELGLNEVAWDRRDTLEILEHVHGWPLAILGGDVYRLTSGRLEPTCDSWFCNRHTGESAQEFALRSQQAAREFVSSESGSPDDYFVLVVDEASIAGL